MRRIRLARIAIAARNIMPKPSFFSSFVVLSTRKVVVSFISPMGFKVAVVWIVYSPEFICGMVNSW